MTESNKTRSVVRTLDVKALPRQPHTWKVTRRGPLIWATDVTARVFFVRAQDFKTWEEEKPVYPPIPAGLWEFQKNGTLRVVAPQIGYELPFEIPPGQYHIVVEWERSRAATRETIEIPPTGKPVPSPAELAEGAFQSPIAQFRRDGKKLLLSSPSRPLGDSGEWEEITGTPPDEPYSSPCDNSRDKVDPFPDVKAAMPVLVADIQRASTNIWCTWWALSDNFPTKFNAAGRPTRFLRDEIKAVLQANPKLNVYMIVWEPLNGLRLPPHPAKFARPQDLGRLHINWQANIGQLVPGRVWAGAHHQKFILIDFDPATGDSPREGAVLWCRGWDGLITYWDQHTHDDPDPYLSSRGKSHQPWHDSAIRVVSEVSSRAFENEFRRRWAKGGFAPPLPMPPPTFKPLPVGNTTTVPKIHREFTRNGPEENWYRATIPTVQQGFYIENQYFDEMPPAIKQIAGIPPNTNRIPRAIIARFLAAESAGSPISGAVVICHPKVMSPFLLRPSARKNVALIRALTARSLTLGTSAGAKRFNRPVGGWAFCAVVPPLRGGYFRALVIWPGGGAVGTMQRAIGGVACLTMVTPDVKARRKFRPVYLHSKFAVMDGSYMLGSTNISDESFFIDSEADVVVPDPVETSRVMARFFPNLVGGGAAPGIKAWVDRMARIAARNYDMEIRKIRWAPVGRLTEFPYR
jgi:phosphatidylserine/phosphatidylglycerophosphate/cardiolipin synthase-like enzyme